MRVVANYILLLEIIGLAFFISYSNSGDATKQMVDGQDDEVIEAVALHPVDRDEYVPSNAANKKSVPVSDEVREFLTEAADGRLMDAQEGELAAGKGTTSSIREYGKLMMMDQAMLLEKLKAIASHKNVSLPTHISKEKQEGSEDLKSKSGDEFDKKFVRMMIIDHKRDIRLYKKASRFDDEEVSEYARTYLPVIENHLERIRKIRKAN